MSRNLFYDRLYKAVQSKNLSPFLYHSFISYQQEKERTHATKERFETRTSA
ncbi:hypothetical protein [Cytobacillus purgationiresistens]|uniref:Uncharacterized protein n=1 Tax=Cytobacillus purgationiresistens TaxID=863449 RepID=A0ABU0ARR8_9BACI|nr:hypothetical protein [Cytobacillus purgationiresistens]MDQ0273735.1 hypothetical protein [Cytobacillus purgationiresistens]